VTDEQILNHPDVKQLLRTAGQLRHQIINRQNAHDGIGKNWVPVQELANHLATDANALCWKMRRWQHLNGWEPESLLEEDELRAQMEDDRIAEADHLADVAEEYDEQVEAQAERDREQDGILKDLRYNERQGQDRWNASKEGGWKLHRPL